MSNCFDYVCPQCGSADHIEVQAQIWVLLTDDGTTDDGPNGGNHEWGKTGAARCLNCGFKGTVGNLKEAK